MIVAFEFGIKKIERSRTIPEVSNWARGKYDWDASRKRLREWLKSSKMMKWAIP